MDGANGWDAIVPAGGTARRLGVVDKPGLDVGGQSLLERALAAVQDAGHLVVVGEPRTVTGRAVQWCREQPVGGGPVAAIAAALPHTQAEVVVVLAADLPWIAPAVPALLAAVPTDGVAALVDRDGRLNHLAAAWRRATLVRAIEVGSPAGRSMRSLIEGIEVVPVPDDGGWGADCDTWDDVAAARDRAEPRPS